MTDTIKIIRHEDRKRALYELGYSMEDFHRLKKENGDNFIILTIKKLYEDVVNSKDFAFM